MPTMSVRSTYALDQQTAQDIKRLAGVWGVSQAEVIRRTVRRAAECEASPKLSPADVIAHYAAKPSQRSRAATRRMIESMRRERHAEDNRRGARS